MPLTLTDEPEAPPPAAPPVSPLVARAMDILRSRLVPPPLPVPDFVEPELHRLLGDKVPPPTERALAQIREDWTLQHLHGGDVIITTRVNGYVVILAAGEDEVRELMHDFPDELRPRTAWEWPLGGYWFTRG